MSWHSGNYPASYNNLTVEMRKKALEIANLILEETGNEALAITIGLEVAREWAKKEKNINEKS